MKRQKRIVSFLLVICFSVLGINVPIIADSVAKAEYTPIGTTEMRDNPDSLFSSGEWLYWLDGNYAIIAGYCNYSEKTLKIPEHLGGYSVIGIGHHAFEKNALLQKIQMHNNIIRIAEDSFEKNGGLTIKAYNGSFAIWYAKEYGFTYENLTDSTNQTLADSVIDMTGAPSRSYERLTDEGVIFVTDDTTFINVGSVVFFPGDNTHPTGLAKRVVSIDKTSKKAFSSFAQPEFSEVFVELHGSETAYVDWSKAEFCDGVSLDDVSSSDIHSFTTPVKAGINVDLPGLNLSRNFSVSGSIGLNVGPATISYDIGLRNLLPHANYLRVDIPVSTTKNVSFKFKTTPLRPGEGRIINRINISPRVPFASVGGVINGYLSVDMVFDITGEIKFCTTTTVVHSFTYQNGKACHSKSEDTKNSTFEINGQIKIGPELHAYFVLGWGGFSIRFFEVTAGVFIIVDSSYKSTQVTGNMNEVHCLESSLRAQFKTRFKIGIIKVFDIDGIYATVNLFEYNSNPIIKGHFEQGRLLGECTLKNRSVVFEREENVVYRTVKCDVNQHISEPVQPTKQGFEFVGWYVNAAKSGLGWSDYRFDFSTMRMPYIVNQGILYLYASWKDMYPVTSITLNKASITGFSNMSVTEQLTTTSILPTNANNKAVRWESSNNNVATVDNNGLVRLINAGTATITCRSVGNPAAKATCAVTVKQSVTGIGLNISNIFRYSDNMSPVQLSATVLPGNAVDKSIVWSSDNPSVADVSNTGLVTLKALGTANILCRSVQNPNVVAVCPVAVRQAVTGITLDRESQLRTNADMSPLRLFATIEPSNAYNKALTWESSNQNVATVSDNGTIMMKGLGKTTITCRSVSNPGIFDTFELEIIQAVTEITLNERYITHYSDYTDTIQLTETIKPENAGNKSVTWESSDSGVVTVSSDGVVRIVAAGTATVTCRSISNPDVTADCRFTVLQAVTGITLNKTTIDTISDEINVTYLQAEIEPENAANKSVTWESSNPDVATVTNDGVVAIIDEGDAIITCRSVSQPYITDTCNVHVVLAVSDIRLSQYNIFRYSNQTGDVQLTATLTSEEQANREVRWSSNNTSVATVSDGGIVSFHGIGTATILCVSVSNPDVHAECLVTVRQSVTDIILNKTSIELSSDESEPVQLTASVAPSNAANKKLLWESSNDNVVVVSDTGLVTITGAGSAVITCRSESDPDVTATCAVTVRQAVTSLSLNASSITRYTSETGTIQLVAYIRPPYAYNKAVNWTSSNSSVASISDTGVVTIKGAGNAAITCVSGANPSLTAECEIVVKQAVSSITLDRTTLELYTNATEPVQLLASVEPANAGDKELAWKSSDVSVVTVSDEGKVTVTGTGRALITCKSVSNPNVTATCSVTVKQAARSIILSETELVCYSDDAGPLKLTANVQPVYAEDKAVTWKSSETGVVAVSNNGVLTIKGVGSAVITCTSESDPGVSAKCTVTVKQAMTGITLDRTNAALYTDDEEGLQLTATINPADTDDNSVYWESDNSSVAIVSDTGIVKAVTQGNAHIFCRSARNPEAVYASCDVLIMERVREIHVEGDTASLLPGETVQLYATCYPEIADNRKVNWSSDNPSIATVDNNGLVMAVGYGATTISATASDGSAASGTYAVTVEHELALETIVENSVVYAQGDQDVTLASVHATDASVRRAAENGKTLNWSLTKANEDDDVVMDIATTIVSDHGQDYEASYVVLHGRAFTRPGNNVYTVTCTMGELSESVDIPVVIDGTDYAERASITPPTYDIAVGESVLIPNVPTGADGGRLPEKTILSYIKGDANAEQHATYVKTPEGYSVSFDESGIYTAEVFYDAVNIVYKVNVSFYVRDENGIIRIKADGVAIDNTSVDLVEGEKLKLNATVTPLDTFDASVTWSSTDESVATVDQAGTVTAAATGRAAIICTANDGSGVYGMCAVNVEKFLQLDDNVMEFTVYTSGDNHSDLGIVNVTFDSEKRVFDAGLNVTWQLEKQSGTACEISMEEFRAEAEEGITVSGNRIKLLRIHDAGVDEYTLSCRAGSYSDSCKIRINVVEAVLPAEVALTTTQYEGVVDEIITVDTTYAGAALPENTLVKIEGGRAFENALSTDYDFTKQTELIFAVPGTYTANVVFYCGNYQYVCPIVISVKDKNGNVPVNISDVKVGPDEAHLLVGEQVTLSASVEPEDAAFSQVTWSSSDTNVASVSSDGRVTAIGAGIAFISATVPESDFVGSCVVVVEEGMTLTSDRIDRTVFVDGITRSVFDSVQLTAASSQRLESAPEWRLNRISGNNLTLKVRESNTVDFDGNTIYGCSIILYSLSRDGIAEYELVCRAGDEEAVVPVTVRAVARERSLPSGLTFGNTVFTAGVNELITIIPEIICLPEGTALPDGMRVSLEGNDLFRNLVNTEDYCVSQNMTTLSFSRAGLYEATFAYSYSNMRYAVPVTFRVKDNKGNVPVLATGLSLSSTSLWLVKGETASISAIFTPSNTDDQAVTWTSTDSSVASVDASGRVHANRNGEALLICEPADTRLGKRVCSVRVEDYLTVETGDEHTTLYKQGNQKNEVYSAALSEGTKLRLAKAGLRPEWEITRIQGNHSDVEQALSEDADLLIVNSSSLNSGGQDTYRVTCKAGEYSVATEFEIEVIDLPNIAGYITPAQTHASADVDETFTVDFSPVCHPAGSVLPQDESLWSLYSGIGDDYQNALDHEAYSENGDRVTLRFTKPGHYLFTRQFFLANLHYEQVCDINVGQASASFNILSADTTDAIVYMGGRIGQIAEVSLKDSLLQEVYDGALKWSLECTSGDGLAAILKPSLNGVKLCSVDAAHEGESVWRVTCAFGDYSDHVDIRVSVMQPRSTVPEKVELANNHIRGMIGDWLEMPIVPICAPTGSALPDTGDDFWTFEPTGTAGDACSWSIANGILSVRCLCPGYYTGILKYEAGSFAFTMPVYMAITDEEGVLAAPSMEMYLSNVVDVVYMNGMDNAPIALAEVARGIGSYYAGEAQSYVDTHPGTWKVSVTSGDAASLDIEPMGNTAQVVVKDTRKEGSVHYTVQFTVEDKVYTKSGTVSVLNSSAERPDPTMSHSIYYGEVGEPMTIPTTLYERKTGSILQGASKWMPNELLKTIGYEFTEREDAIHVTFYKEGTYSSSLSVNVGNLHYDIPFTIVIGEPPATHSILKMPKALTSIDDYAFEGSGAEIVDLRETRVASIGAGAFRNCSELATIYLPATVTDIADDAFYGCINVTIVCEPGSAADAFATKHSIPVRHE